MHVMYAFLLLILIGALVPSRFVLFFIFHKFVLFYCLFVLIFLVRFVSLDIYKTDKISTYMTFLNEISAYPVLYHRQIGRYYRHKSGWWEMPPSRFLLFCILSKTLEFVELIEQKVGPWVNGDQKNGHTS